MENRIQELLIDVLKSCDYIQLYMSECNSFSEYENDTFLQHSVERNIEIIGEALNNARKLNPQIPISRLTDIINTRNKLIHGYDAVDNALVYTIVIKHIPILKSEVAKIQQDHRGLSNSRGATE